MKVLRFAIKFVIFVFVIAIAAVLTLPLWIGPVAKTLVNSAGPKCTKTCVSLGEFALNPYSGGLLVGGLYVGNPSGYRPSDALRIGRLEMSVDPISLASDVVHVQLISIRDVFFSYVSENKVSNIDAIMANAGVKKVTGKSKEPTSAQDETPAAERNAEKPSKKVIIDRFEMNGVVIQLGPIPLPVPPLMLTDIGKKSCGVTIEEAWNQIFASIMKSAGVMTEDLRSFQSALGDGVDDLGKHSAKVGEAAARMSANAGRMTNAAAAMTKSAGEVTESAGKSVEDIGKGVKSAADALKSLW